MTATAAAALGFLRPPWRKAQSCRFPSSYSGKGVRGFPEAEDPPSSLAHLSSAMSFSVLAVDS